MNGSLFYGPLGRLLSVLAGIVAVIGSLEAQGVFNLLPHRYKWIGPAATAVGVGITVFSERIQGGASKPEVRAAAAKSDAKNANEEIRLEEINK